MAKTDKSAEAKPDATPVSSSQSQQGATDGTGAGSPAPKESAWDESALKQAEEYGISPEDALEMGAPDKVLRALGSLHKRLADKAPAKETESKKAKGINLEALRAGGFDDVADALESLQGDLGSVKTVAEELKAERDVARKAAQEQFHARADEMIEGLDTSFDDLFADSVRAAPLNRKRVRDKMESLKKMLESAGERVPGEEAMFKSALIMLWPKRDIKSKAAEAEAPTRRYATTIQPPTHVNGRSDANPEDRALDFIRRFQMEHGKS